MQDSLCLFVAKHLSLITTRSAFSAPWLKTHPMPSYKSSPRCGWILPAQRIYRGVAPINIARASLDRLRREDPAVAGKDTSHSLPDPNSVESVESVVKTRIVPRSPTTTLEE